MKLPKYMREKILQRARLQGKANRLQLEIEEWCNKHGIEPEYAATHICLFIEPGMVALNTIREIEEA